MNPLFREAIAAYLRDIGITFTLAEDGTLICDPPLTGNARLEVEMLARELSETIEIK
jgi:hypothetical protein